VAGGDAAGDRGVDRCVGVCVGVGVCVEGGCQCAYALVGEGVAGGWRGWRGRLGFFEGDARDGGGGLPVA